MGRGRRLVVAALVAALGVVAVVSSPASRAAAGSVTTNKNAYCWNYTAYNGTTQQLCADVYVPAGTAPSGGWPVVFVVHGSRTNGDKNSIAPLATAFAQDGYVAIAPNYRLVCRPGDPPVGVNPLMCGFYFPTQSDDVDQAIQVFNTVYAPGQAQPFANLADEGIVGGSSGGNIALNLATNIVGSGSPEIGSTFRAVASLSGEIDFNQAPYSPWVDPSKNDISREVLGIRQYTNCGHTGYPACTATLFSEDSPINHVTASTPPLYLGNAKDDNIPYQASVEMVDVARSQSPPIPVFLRQGPGIDHGAKMLPTVVGVDGVTTIQDEMLAFFDTLMKPSPTSDLQVTAAASAGNLAIGAPVTDTFSITNLGPGWTSADFTTTVPGLAKPSSVKVRSSAGSCRLNSSTGTVTCSLGLIPLEGQDTVSLTFTPIRTGSPQITGTASSATISLPNPPGSTLQVPDPNPANDSATLTNAVGPQVTADLAATAQVTAGGTPPAGQSEQFVYTLRAQNLSASQTVTGVTLTDSGPTGVQIQSATASQGTCSVTAASFPVTCNLGDLAGGATATVTVDAAAGVPSSVTLSQNINNPLQNTVRVGGMLTDSNPANDTATAAATVSGASGTPDVVLLWNGPAPSPVSVPLGGYVDWVADNAAPPVQCGMVTSPGCYPAPAAWPAWDHEVADGSTMGLFRSPMIPPGGVFTYQFTAAGKYTVKDNVTNVTAKVNVPLQVAPASGTQSSNFQVTWATQAPPPGFVYDVQILRPNSTTFVPWLTGVTSLTGTFTPDAGVGVYKFQARLREPTVSGANSDWCNGVLITVTS